MSLQKRGTTMSNDERIAVLETTNAHILDSLARIENRLTAIDNDIKTGFKDVNNRMWSNFIWMITALAALFAVMAHGFHWF